MKRLIVKTLIVVAAICLFMAGSTHAQAQGSKLQEYAGSVGKAGHTIELVNSRGMAIMPPIKADRSGNFTFSISESELKKYENDEIGVVVKDQRGKVLHRERVGIIVVDGTLGIEPGHVSMHKSDLVDTEIEPGDHFRPRY